MTETFTELIGNGKSKPLDIAPNDVLAFVPCGPFTEVYLVQKRCAVIDIPYSMAKEKFIRDEWEKENIYSEGEL